MKLKSVQIKNYRSIEDISFEMSPLEDGTFTYGLIGVNEAGKSSVLKALALRGGLININQKDFRYKTKPVEVIYLYIPSVSEVDEFKAHLAPLMPDLDSASIDFSELYLKVTFGYANPAPVNLILEIKNFNGDDKSNAQEHLKEIVFGKAHKPIFWTAEDKYLISQPIKLAEFAGAPESKSIPLRNCFALAGITNIQERINGLANDSTEIEQLQTELGEKVTEHIKNIWPNHPIKITFLITDGLIHFHVNDLDAKGKAKTADQRSDGFKQFVSFLLTVSAQNKNDEISNSILLLDEPETHLHPQAQEYLLGELIKISKNDRNNIVFFATHSNYMIDKNDLSRNFRVKKDRDETKREQFDKKVSSYASVTYEVFDIPSTDYHNELYSKLHEFFQDADTADTARCGILNFDTEFFCKGKKLKKDRPWKGTANQATLPTYIRNCIHHSDNGDTYKDADLRKSIELLRSYL